jgi:tetratricopeptide (TPR) repeat protein
MNRPLFGLITCGGGAIVLALLALTGCAGDGGGGSAGGDRAVGIGERPVGVDYYVQAVNAYNRGNNEQAIVLLLEATRRNPDLRMSRSLLGDLYRARSDYRQAIPNYERLAALDPYTASNHYRLGLMYQLVNRLRDAAAAYLRALELDPKDWRANMNLGLVYLALNQIDDAVTYLERASVLEPENAEIWSNLGVALDARGSVVLAEAAYKKSLELDGSQSTTLLNLGSNLVAQGKGEDALTVMSRAVEEIDTPPARKRYGDALALNQQYEFALQQYDRALAKDPNYWPAVTDKGFLMINLYRRGLELEEKQKNEAIRLWKRSLSLNPNQPRVQAALKQWSAGGLFGD